MLSALLVFAILHAAFFVGIVLSAMTAKLCRMRVDRVAFGFGPSIVGVDVAGTRWQVGAFLLGGFVQIAGRDATDRPVPQDDPRAFHNRPRIVRALPTLAWALAFALGSGLIASGSFLIWGVPRAGQTPVIAGTIPGRA